MSNNPTSKINSAESLEKAKASLLVYPSDLGSRAESKYTIFNIYRYNKSAVNRVETTQCLGQICLPIPPELSNNDALNYEEYSAPILNTALEAFQKGGVADSAKAFAALGATFAAETLAKIKGGNVVNQVSALTGSSINPRNTNIFKNPTAREHRFTFRLIAKSADESESIKKIINRFRYHAYPETGSSEAFYFAPDLFNISFKYSDKTSDDKDTYLFHPLPSALVSIGVSYNGNSSPIFYQNTGAPVEVSLSLVFREMEIDNKEKLLQRYNIDGVAPIKKIDDLNDTTSPATNSTTKPVKYAHHGRNYGKE